MDAVDRGVHDLERGRRRCRCLGMQCMARKDTRQARGDDQSCMRRNHTKTLLIGETLMSCYAAMMCPSNPRSVMAVPYERKSGEAFNRDAGGSAPEALAMASCCQWCPKWRRQVLSGLDRLL